MKIKVHKSRFKSIVLGIMAIAVMAGCSKEKTPNPVKASVTTPATESQSVVSIEKLTAYYASEIKADEKLVTYDEKTQQIVFRGVNQIDRATLTRIYLINTKSNN
jgi:uncharacterized lipoprotein YajG